MRFEFILFSINFLFEPRLFLLFQTLLMREIWRFVIQPTPNQTICQLLICKICNVFANAFFCIWLQKQLRIEMKTCLLVLFLSNSCSLPTDKIFFANTITCQRRKIWEKHRKSIWFTLLWNCWIAILNWPLSNPIFKLGDMDFRLAAG